jgi:hypothetical protein
LLGSRPPDPAIIIETTQPHTGTLADRVEGRDCLMVTDRGVKDSVAAAAAERAS